MGAKHLDSRLGFWSSARQAILCIIICTSALECARCGDVSEKRGRENLKFVADALIARNENLKKALYTLERGSFPEEANSKEYQIIRKEVLNTIASKEKLAETGDLKYDFIGAAYFFSHDPKLGEISGVVVDLLDDDDIKTVDVAMLVLHGYSKFMNTPRWFGLNQVQMMKIFDIARIRGGSLLKLKPIAADICVNLLERELREAGTVQKRKQP